MDQCGPLLVYDREFRNVSCSDEKEIKEVLMKLFLMLRSSCLDDVKPILRQLFRHDIRLPSSVENILLPRIIEYVQPRFHATNFRGFQFIGGGGFGTVFRAEHRIDGKSYAIKVVEGIRSLKDLSRASSEVSVMANLRHLNVVQYITSWIEYGSEPFTEEMHVPDAYCSSDSQDSLLDEHNGVAMSNNEDLSSESSLLTSNGTSSDDESSSHIHDQSSSFVSHSQQLQLTAFRSKRTHQRLFVPRLFIQLELCNYNLAEWLQHRNVHLSCPADQVSTKPWWPTVPHGPARWLSDQLACGLAYLHANAMMHRDLKPENVLLTGPPLSTSSHKPCGCPPLAGPHFADSSTSCLSVDETNCYHRLTVKICDFGLSRFLNQPSDLSVPLAPPMQRTSGSDKPDPCTHANAYRHYVSKSFTGGPRCSSCHLSRRPRRRAYSDRPTVHHTSQLTTNEVPQMSAHANDSNPDVLSNPDNLLTGHLGSELYAAPEVRPNACFKRRLRYDFKADIYSMGVIFFQLFYPFFTVHELVMSLQEICHPDWPPSTNSSDSLGHQQQPILVPSAHNNIVRRSTALNSFVFSWPDESRLVSRMLCDEPAKRPSAIELQSILSTNSELPNLVHRPCVTETNDRSSRIDTIQSSEDHVSPITNHRLLDMVLWRNQELEREAHELRQRLAYLESVVREQSQQSNCNTTNNT